MFCPKCGTKNPEDGKFCRKCGTDLAGISDVISGGSTNYLKVKGRDRDKNGWEGALGPISTGIAFLLIAIILGVTGAAGGRYWWYWMLIPAFSMIGSGAAKIIRFRAEANKSSAVYSESQEAIQGTSQHALPPTQTAYVSPETDSNFETGDLVPASVVENTTKLLELDENGNAKSD
jgi:hypothetical protein